MSSPLKSDVRPVAVLGLVGRVLDRKSSPKDSVLVTLLGLLGLLMAERRKQATQADITEALHVVLSLPIEIDRDTTRHVAGETTGLARQYGLTIYDAAYLELAMRRGATLATSDAALARAAKKAGVSVL